MDHWFNDSMRKWTHFSIPALAMGFAVGLVVGGVAPGHADHLTPKHDPWGQPWELERLALLDVPEVRLHDPP